MPHELAPRRVLALALLALSAVTSACGATADEVPPPLIPATVTPATAALSSSSKGTPVGAPAPGVWQTWSPEQKEAWMRAGVFPKMRELFGAVDASRYGEMSCKTCHGMGAIEGSYKMPNRDLPKLDPDPAAFKTLEQTNPKMFHFMATQVEPTMASLLAVQPHDMKTNTGFGCFNCHTKK